VVTIAKDLFPIPKLFEKLYPTHDNGCSLGVKPP
jgi:hypothetical protein